MNTGQIPKQSSLSEPVIDLKTNNH